MTLDQRGDARVLTHPLAQHTLVDLRDVETDPVAFRRELHRLGRVCGYTLAAEYFETEPVEVQTPLAPASGRRSRPSIARTISGGRNESCVRSPRDGRPSAGGS